ncbi:MAG: rhodanese-like domain-containing protein [Myxococcota bacterium]
MRQVSVEEARDLLASPDPPQLLDCREPWEHARCHIAGDVLMPLGELAEHAGDLDRARPVLVYCHHGIRSINGAMLLEQLGFAAMSLRGGIDAWSQRIDPTVPRY